MRINVKHFLDKDSLHVGEFLTGTAVISVKKPAYVQKVVLKLTCLEWTEPGIGDDYDFDFRKTRRLAVPFLTHEETGGQLYEPGEYSFPFWVRLDPESPDWRVSPSRHSLDLPMPHALSTFPSALKQWTCKVIWGVRVKVFATKYDPSKPSKKGPKSYRSEKQEIDIWGNWNPLHDPPQQRETDRAKDSVKKRQKYVIMSGGMNAEAWLDKDFYWAGEEVKVDLRIQNLSNTDLSYVSVQHLKFVKCTCHGKKSTFKENLEKKSVDIHLKTNPFPVVDGQMVLPTLTFKLPNNGQSMRGLLINIAFEFRVTFHNNSMLATALVLKIPCTILSPNPSDLSATFISSKPLRAPANVPATNIPPAKKHSKPSVATSSPSPKPQGGQPQQGFTQPVQGFGQPVQGFGQPAPGGQAFAGQPGFGYQPVYIIAQPTGAEGGVQTDASGQPVQYQQVYIIQQPFGQPTGDGSQPQYVVMPQGGFPQGQVFVQGGYPQGQPYMVQGAPQGFVQPDQGQAQGEAPQEHTQ